MPWCQRRALPFLAAFLCSFFSTRSLYSRCARIAHPILPSTREKIIAHSASPHSPLPLDWNIGLGATDGSLGLGVSLFRYLVSCEIDLAPVMRALRKG